MPFEELLSCLLMAALCVLLFIKSNGLPQRKQKRLAGILYDVQHRLLDHAHH
ncbi:hypothetical protein [Bacillus licheniformis]|uniref:hypothetical protein n=1 Tax=Bacillus licheniformis TaxID=1402 RepID=UPI00163D7B08|nr:hypothetical protein [Bacillus licheniformis]